MAELSTNARKLQEEEIERLVKCRIRSETEARKAAEATTKRAVQEARELKKELMIMRQEKEELKQESKKAVIAAATTPTPGGVVTKDDLQKKLSQQKAKYKETMALLQTKENELVQARQQLEHFEQDKEKSQLTHRESIQKVQNELKSSQHEVETLQEEVKKLKGFVEEAKRKCQRAVKEKKQELQLLMDENAQLAKRCEGLERLADENMKLRKQIEKAKDKQGGIADEWQRKLDQRDEAFLRQEQENKKDMIAKQHEIDALKTERDSLQQELGKMEAQQIEMERSHEAQLDREQEKVQELVASTKQLQERLTALKDAGRAADRARLDAEARLAKAIELRETAESAADAVEARAEKAEAQLEEARHQLDQIDKALKKKGISIDYLIKQVAPRGGTINSSVQQVKASTKEPAEPQDEGSESPASKPSLIKTKTEKTLSSSSMAQLKTTRNGVVSTGNASKAKSGVAMGPRTPSGSDNQRAADREATPERTRK